MNGTLDIAAAETFNNHEVAANQAFGFWLFLMSDLVLFAVLFAVYVVQGDKVAGGPSGRELFDLPYSFVETMLLLLSSTAFAMALPAISDSRKRPVGIWLCLTFLLGLGFIIMELDEFSGMVLDGNGPARSAFLSSFFTLVGTHGLHVTSGLIWLIVLLGQVAVKGLIPSVQSRLIRLSMFWHFLDIVWIGVFSIVYLSGSI